jgi:zinc/manganese transport system substrate-binding protein
MPVRLGPNARLQLLVAPIASVCLIAGACSQASEPNTQADSSVVATVSVWADLTQQLLCETPVTVETLLPAGSDPHQYELSLQQRASVDAATVVVSNGFGLEETLVGVLRDVQTSGGTVIEVGSLLDDERVRHDNNTPDPHFWLDPQRVSEALGPLSQQLTNAGIIDAQAAESCLVAVQADLATLDDEIAQRFADLPDTNRSFLTGHRDLSYFAQRYGLQVAGSINDSSSTHHEADAEHLAELIELVVEQEITVLFMTEGEPDAAVDALRNDVGLDVVYVTNRPAPGDSYQDMLRELASTISEALM